MKKIYYKIVSMCLMLVSIFSVAFCNVTLVEAKERISTAFHTSNGEVVLSTGEAEIIITGNEGQSLVGKTFAIYPVFYAENSMNEESINYEFADDSKSALQNLVGEKLNMIPTEVTEFEVIDYIQSLNNYITEGAQADQFENGSYSEFRYFIEELRNEMEYLESYNMSPIYVNDVTDEGDVHFKGLKYGYYLIDEISANEGSHSASSMCMVSTSNPKSTIHIKSDYPDLQKKIQEDDNQDVIGNFGWNDIGDYEIGQNIPYKFTSRIMNMNGYEKYYFAWHDVMDDELSFDPNSITITITNESYDYVLTKEEYSLKENVSGETFIVEIDDLKEIVDTNFNRMDDLGHNEYNQSITLEYQAKLNDLAAVNMSNKGFENDVRLEFSNDPDSDGSDKTGFTPWDTVVCYTYGLNGLKINNYENVLSDAKFRLYTDEKCEEEVFVKQGEHSYIVMNKDNLTNENMENAVEMSSNDQGEFIITGLDSGVYYLKETDAPIGYRAILDPIRIEIIPTFIDDRNSYLKGTGDSSILDLAVNADIKQFLNGVQEDSEQKLEVDLPKVSANLIVVNTVGSKLPVTGSFATIALIGVGAMLMILSFLFKSKRSVN